MMPKLSKDFIDLAISVFLLIPHTFSISSPQTLAIHFVHTLDELQHI